MAFQDMVDYLDSCWCARNQIVPCLVGPVGIGKTAAVNQHAKNVGANKVVTIIASQILPNEVSGITMPDSETKAMEIYDHFRLSNMQDGDILFFDELLEADQMVLKACLTLIESRELMSGNKLPDIQIVAATNPSIAPDMLKENIRQRFLFRKFDIDETDTFEYIKKETGLDLSEIMKGRLVETGKEYNILTPRSLTKMAKWTSLASSREEGLRIARAIDSSWNTELGQKLFECKWQRRTTKNDAKRVVRDIVAEHISSMTHADEGVSRTRALIENEERFENASLDEMMETIQSLEGFDKIIEKLSTIEISDGKDTEGVQF